MSVTPERLLNIIFSEGSSGPEKADAVKRLKKITSLDRDGLVKEFGRLLTSQGDSSPSDSEVITDLNNRIMELQLELINFRVEQRGKETDLLPFNLTRMMLQVGVNLFIIIVAFLGQLGSAIVLGVMFTILFGLSNKPKKH